MNEVSRAFTPQEQAYLASLPAVSSVSENTITYAPQFRASCMDRYYAGESPAEIFRSEGLDPALIGAKRIERCVARWRHSVPQRETPTPPAKRDLAVENRILRSRAAALEGLVELARAREGRVVPKARRFELIEELRGRMDDLSLTAACEALGVSEGGYYHWRARRDAQGEGM
ncbi:HTH domain-containing protein [[Collinsella] massiliensis]|uniref:Transposase n=1 Tax=[Collinsella] massiliensis TaxID=1232426 RepID=A0A1Y3XVU3_9ACTN|nr:HTH domain-containing protein [[Collinsella] massiliensis]OUN89706.1 hypothetical protein B5G02_01345 [[Collinsella] massiliensis]